MSRKLVKIGETTTAPPACPDCNSPMSLISWRQENITTSVSNVLKSSDSAKIESVEVNDIYRCPNCGSIYIWVEEADLR